MCEKIIERLISNGLSGHLEKNKLLSGHQLGFPSLDLFESQLLPIAHEVYLLFNDYSILKTCGIFLDISNLLIKSCMGINL